MAKLTQKQEAACQAYIECRGNQSEAYRQAYDAENMKPESVWVEACKVFANPNVAQRVIALQKAHAERHNVTVDTITAELDENRKVAKEEKQSAATMEIRAGIDFLCEKLSIQIPGSESTNEINKMIMCELKLRYK